MIYEIRPIAEDHIPSFRETLDTVAREQKFLSFLEAPPLEQMRHFVLNNINEGYPEFVVLIDDQIGGWCDVLPNPRRTVQAHCGTQCPFIGTDRKSPDHRQNDAITPLPTF